MVTEKQVLEILLFCARETGVDRRKLPQIRVEKFTDRFVAGGVEYNQDGALGITNFGNLVLSVSPNPSDLAWVVTHEFAHFLQYLAGDLTFNIPEKKAFYKGQEAGVGPYLSRPEERDARARGEDLLIRWNRFCRNKTCKTA